MFAHSDMRLLHIKVNFLMIIIILDLSVFRGLFSRDYLNVLKKNRTVKFMILL